MDKEIVKVETGELEVTDKPAFSVNFWGCPFLAIYSNETLFYSFAHAFPVSLIRHKGNYLVFPPTNDEEDIDLSNVVKRSIASLNPHLNGEDLYAKAVVATPKQEDFLRQQLEWQVSEANILLVPSRYTTEGPSYSRRPACKDINFDPSTKLAHIIYKDKLVRPAPSVL